MFVSLGEPRKAADTLMPQPRAAFCEDTFAVLAELHPPTRHAIPAELQDPTDDIPAQVGASTLAEVLRKLRHGVAPGPSLLANDHLLTLFPVETDSEVEALALLLSFVNKVRRRKRTMRLLIGCPQPRSPRCTSQTEKAD
jgi:hypothetical protein